MERSYIAIDLKSFYASVECREMGLDPLDALLVVADEMLDVVSVIAFQPARSAYPKEASCVLVHGEDGVGGQAV